MYLDNVFYGFTKEGVYRLLWRKYKTRFTSVGEVNYTVYYDLERKIEIPYQDVDTDTLKPITKLVGKKRRLNRKKVKSVFETDANFLIDVKGTFYGDIIKKMRLYGNSTFINKKKIRESQLFARINDPKGRSMEMKTNFLYPHAERVIEGVCVKEIRPINVDEFDEVVQPKRKLLEMDYRKEL